jgi:hypothetical protein
MEDLRQRLSETIDEARLDWLKPHIQKDVTILVAAGLDLLDVGVALANDDATSVQRWISEQLLVKPSPEMIASWQDRPDLKFSALIVQPFVLIQEI